MKWMKPVFDTTFFGGKYGRGAVKTMLECWHNIRRGGYLMMMLDYKEGGEVKNLGKSDYVISEYS